MKHLISTKSLAAVALALGAIVAASSAHARSDVFFSIGVQVPGVYVQPMPVYVQPMPVYVQPRQYYAPAPHFYAPAPIYYQRHDNGRHYGAQQWQGRGPYGDRDRDGIANIHDSGNQRNQWRQARFQGPHGDMDRDGVRNQHDRDRDGDGVRNRYDRLPDNPNRR